MAEKRTTPEAGRRKRAAPTIDLTASEVPPVAEASAPPASTPEPPPPPEPPAAAATPPGENPPGGDSWAWVNTNFSGPVLAAGLAGAGSVALLLFALWLTGLVPIRYAGSTATRARVAALEMEVQALQHRPAGAVDTKAVDALTERVGKMEAAISKLPANNSGMSAEMADRVATAENAMKSLGVALAALNRRSDGIAADATQARVRAEAAEKAVTELRNSAQDAAKNASPALSPADLDALQKRIADLERSAKVARDEIARTGAADATARLALSAAALRDAVFSGAPYSALLAQVKSLGADEKLLAPLVPFAASGTPSSQSLAQELRALLPAMIKISGSQTTPQGGFIERLQANAGNLVRVRPVDAPASDDAAAVLARIEIATAKADVGAALNDLGKLPETTRAPAQAWIAKMQARVAAATAVRTLVADTSRALGPK
jgi:hypothetical protein